MISLLFLLSCLSISLSVYLCSSFSVCLCSSFSVCLSSFFLLIRASIVELSNQPIQYPIINDIIGEGKKVSRDLIGFRIRSILFEFFFLLSPLLSGSATKNIDKYEKLKWRFCSVWIWRYLLFSIFTFYTNGLRIVNITRLLIFY